MGKVFFENLIPMKRFDEIAKIIEIEEDSDKNFLALMKYKKWKVFIKLDWKLSFWHKELIIS